MKKKMLFVLCALAGMISGSLISCSAFDPKSTEQSKVEENQKRLVAETGIPVLTKSLDRKAISKRLMLFEDENKISYIYLVSFGKVMSFYVVKGKVTSASKRLTSNEQLISCDLGQAHGQTKSEAPGLDGTYGPSDSYVFFWTTDDTYVQWSGDYMLCDKPLKLNTTPDLVLDITPKK